MQFMVQAKKAVHLAAVGVVALMGFLETPAGKALVAQYPKVAPIAGAVGVLVALYSNPSKSGS